MLKNQGLQVIEDFVIGKNNIALTIPPNWTKEKGYQQALAKLNAGLEFTTVAIVYSKPATDLIFDNGYSLMSLLPFQNVYRYNENQDYIWWTYDINITALKLAYESDNIIYIVPL